MLFTCTFNSSPNPATGRYRPAGFIGITYNTCGDTSGDCGCPMGQGKVVEGKWGQLADRAPRRPSFPPKAAESLFAMLISLPLFFIAIQPIFMKIAMCM